VDPKLKALDMSISTASACRQPQRCIRARSRRAARRQPAAPAASKVGK
jgi:hypothetical protein